MTPIFFYDLSSPYAYLTANRIDQVLPEARWQPIAFGVLLRETGRVPWSLGPSPDADFEELDRRAEERGLPALRYPGGWPRDSYSLAPLRAALLAADYGRLREFTLAAYSLEFAEGRVLDVEGIGEAADRAGVPAAAAIGAGEDPAIKDRLRSATEDALARKVVGVPTIAVGDQLFWGDDRLEEAAAAARRAG